LAQKLIDVDRVEVIFGGWTSVSKKALTPVVEKKNHVYFYPVQFEGQECSRNVFYTGAIPNQQITQAVDYIIKKYPGYDFFLMGSDYVFPRTANEVIKNKLIREYPSIKFWEQYIPIGSSDLDTVFSNITKLMPNGGIIFNTINGDTNVPFYDQYNNKYKMTISRYPTVSVSLAEVEIMTIGIKNIQGHYISFNYFMSIQNQKNNDLLTKFRNKYGQDRIVHDPMESVYIAVNVWKQAVQQVGSTSPPLVRKALMGQTFEAPSGTIKVLPNHYIRKKVRIGTVNAQGQIDIDYVSEDVDPVPWSPYLEATKDNVCDWTNSP
jgi:urea transport system substrate-binding protein